MSAAASDIIGRVPADKIVHEVPMRWADLDSLNHVNNVVYLDYAAESRARLAADGIIDLDQQVSSIAIDFLRPLLLSRHPVEVVSRRDDDVLTQEICSQGSDAVFARVVTILGEPARIEPGSGQGDPLPSTIRHSDLGQDGTVSTTKVFELFQEARVFFISSRVDEMKPRSFVVGRLEVLLAEPVVWQSVPYDARCWVGRVGESSFTIQTQLVRGESVLAQCTSVMVGFDLEAQHSRKLSDGEKKQLTSLSLQRSP